MAKLFDKNMFIMMISIMIGVVIITFFIADINARTQEEEKYQTQIENIEKQNVNFTTRLLSSLGYLEKARDSRATGEYHFDLSYLWYTTALVETDNNTFHKYKNSSLDNCTYSIYYYDISYDNFGVAQKMFLNTLNYTYGFKDLVNLYVNLTRSGENLCKLRINTTIYIQSIVENMTFKDGGVNFSTNISNLTALLNESLSAFNNELEIYQGIESDIEKEYNIVGFSEIREQM